MTGVSVQCVRTYKLAVDNACDTTQAGMMAMHELEEKTAELLEKLKAMDTLEAEMFVHHSTSLSFVHFISPLFFLYTERISKLLWLSSRHKLTK